MLKAPARTRNHLDTRSSSRFVKFAADDEYLYPPFLKSVLDIYIVIPSLSLSVNMLSRKPLDMLTQFGLLEHIYILPPTTQGPLRWGQKPSICGDLKWCMLFKSLPVIDSFLFLPTKGSKSVIVRAKIWWNDEVMDVWWCFFRGVNLLKLMCGKICNKF